MAKKTKPYRLIGRQHTGHDEDGKLVHYKTGDKVLLSENQYEAFQDKFEPVKAKDEVEVEDPVKVLEPVKPPVAKTVATVTK